MEKIKSQFCNNQARELAGFYFDIATNARTGLFSSTDEFENIAIADTFFMRGRILYYRFEELLFDKKTAHNLNRDAHQRIVDQLVADRTQRTSHVASLYQVAADVWAKAEAQANRTNNSEHSRLSHKATDDYVQMLRNDKGSNIEILDPNQVDLAFLSPTTTLQEL